MQIIKTHYKNLSFESGGEHNGEKGTASKSPSAEQRSQQKGAGETKQHGKYYGGPIP